MHAKRAGGAVAILFALVVGASTRTAGSEASSETIWASKSVRGTLKSVDQRLRAVVMESDTGEHMAWRFEAPVIAEAAKFAAGSPVIVIYRHLAENEKKVTALAFPGSADKPTYVNLTGARVVLRSAPMAAGACADAGAGPVSESLIPASGRAEALEACWCCAPAGSSCNPTTKTGVGLAFLVSCFD